MPEKPSVYHRPDTLSKALYLLGQLDTYPLAGGTKLLADDVTGAVVDLQALGLNQVGWEKNGLRVGPTTTLAELAKTLVELGQENNPTNLFRQTIQQAGPNTYRNAATLGGTIASRLPDSELLAFLLLLDTSLTLHTPEKMDVALTDYMAAGERPAGLITDINMVWKPGDGNNQRVARTPADYPIVSITLWRPAGSSVRLAATGITERPVRLTGAEQALIDGLSEMAIAAAATAAKEQSSHPGDFRGSRQYRAEMAAVLTRRACDELARSTPAPNS